MRVNLIKVEALTREVVQLMLGFELAHVGINETWMKMPPTKQQDVLNPFSDFGEENRRQSVFAGTAVEVMKAPWPGR